MIDVSHGAGSSEVRSQQQLSPRLSPRSRIGQLTQPWHAIINWLTRPSELQVWQRLRRCKPPYWQAYDPKTGRSFGSTSEAEMRQWIEQRYRG